MKELQWYLEAKETTVSNLLLSYYKKIGLTEKEFLFFLQMLSFQQKGENFPNLQIISERMEEKIEVIYDLLQSLISKKCIKLLTETDERGKQSDAYDLMIIFEKIVNVIVKEQQHSQTESKEQQIGDLYQLFEKEFGRPLSPIELESISYWLEEDHYSPDLIRLALREAVLNQAYSLKYIDRILLAWERKNYRTKEQVMEEQKKRKKALSEKDSQKEDFTEDLPQVPLYNWLNPDNQQ